MKKHRDKKTSEIVEEFHSCFSETSKPVPRIRELRIMSLPSSHGFAGVAGVEFDETAIDRLTMEIDVNTRAAFIAIVNFDGHTTHFVGSFAGIDRIWRALIEWKRDTLKDCDLCISECVLVEYSSDFKKFILKD